LAAIITMVAFVCAVNAAIFVEGQTTGAATVMRYLLAGLTGGLVGAGVMALGIGLLPAGPRQAAAWWPMLITGTLAGTLLALDNALGLDQISFLYPVWQAAVAVRLVMALRS
jgi:Na+/citrate or Na+/malate symporter